MISMAKEIAARQLTSQQSVFVSHILVSGDPRAAAEKAEYANSEVSGYRVAALPAVREAIREGIAGLLETRAAPLALQALLDVVGDPAANVQARVAAAKTLLDRAGFAPKTDNGATLDAASMSSEQLRGLANGLEAELAKRAEVLPDSAPKRPIIDVDVAEMLD
jgi:hypothetical protein